MELRELWGFTSCPATAVSAWWLLVEPLTANIWGLDVLRSVSTDPDTEVLHDRP